MARSRKTQTTDVIIPTVTDEQYKEVLAIRLAAMHGFADGTVDEQTMKAARAAVRKARKVRKAEAEILEAYREHLAKQAEAKSQAAKKAAATRRSRKAQPKAEPTAEVTENETPVENDTPVEVAA